MTKFKKDLFVVIALVIALSALLLAPLWVGITLIVVFAITILAYRKYGPKVGETEKPKEPEINDDGVNMDWQSEVSSEEAYRYLMHSNYRLRVDGNNLRFEDVAEIEALIDDLRNLVLIVESSTSVLKWKVNQICADFMPKLINRFLMASSESRIEIMSTTVEDIRSRLSEIETVVNNNNQQEFEHYATTLQKIMKA